LSRNASILRRETSDIGSNGDRLQQELSTAKEQELSAARAKEQRAERAAKAREVAEARESEGSPPPRRRSEPTRPHSFPDTTEFQPPFDPSGGGLGGASSGGRMVVTRYSQEYGDWKKTDAVLCGPRCSCFAHSIRFGLADLFPRFANAQGSPIFSVNQTANYPWW